MQTIIIRKTGVRSEIVLIVCICNCISDRHINGAIDRGICTFEALQKELKVSTSCGICAETVKCLLEQKLNQNVQNLVGGRSNTAPAISFSNS